VDWGGGRIGKKKGGFWERGGKNGGEDNPAGPRMENWPARRQRVSGRASGRRDNQSIGVELRERFAVDSGAQHDQARKFASAQDSIVQREHLVRSFIAEGNPGFEQRAVTEINPVFCDAFDSFAIIRGTRAGQETKRANV